MIEIILLLAVMISMSNAAYPTKESPIVSNAIDFLFMEDSYYGANATFKGTFFRNMTKISFGNWSISELINKIEISPCRLTETRNKTCTRLDAVYGYTIYSTTCESPNYNGLNFFNAAYSASDPQYDATPAPDVIDKSNACKLIQCEMFTNNFSPRTCAQFGIGGTRINFSSVGVYCGDDSACDFSSNCGTSRGDECNSNITVTIPSGIYPGIYNISLENQIGTTVMLNAIEIVSRPRIHIISTSKHTTGPFLSESLQVTPGAVLDIEYTTDRPIPIDMVLDYYYLSDKNMVPPRIIRFESNNIIPTPFVLGAGISIKNVTLGAVFIYKGSRFDIDMSARFLVSELPVLYSLCPSSALAFTITTFVVQGAFFKNSSELQCMFEGSVVPHTYISPAVIHCTVNPTNSTRRIVSLIVSIDNGDVFSTSSLDVVVLGACESIKPNSIPLNSQCVCRPGYKDAVYACIPCDIGTYQEFFDQNTCTPCDSTQTTIQNQQTSSDSCVCVSGTYNDPTGPDTDTDTDKCIACPVGFSCINNTKVVLKGFWNQYSDSSRAVKCEMEGCAGGFGSGDELCKTGYVGPLCGVCDVGYSQYDIKCVKCEGRRIDTAILCFLVISVIIILYIIVRLSTAVNVLSGAEEIEQSRKKGCISSVVKLVSTYLQILYYIGGTAARWDKNSATFFSLMIPLSLSPSFVSVRCASGSGVTFYDRIAFIMLLPLIICVGLAFIYFFKMIACLLTKYTLFVMNLTSYLKTLLIILYIFLPMMTEQLFRGLKCVDIDGVQGSFLEEDLRISCQNTKYQTYRIFIIIYIIGYVGVGVGSVMYRIYLKREYLTAIVTEGAHDDTIYGYFVRGYTERALLWESVILFLKLVVVGTSLASNVLIQLVWCLIFISAILAITTKINPYSTLVDNRLSVISLSALVISTILAIHSVILGKEAGTGIFIILLIVNLFAMFSMLTSSWKRVESFFSLIIQFIIKILTICRLINKNPDTNDEGIVMYQNPSSSSSSSLPK
jgi:hypothetical protein